MTSSRRVSRLGYWPFGLLLAAWLCANIPGHATVQLFTWLRGAGHFAHHRELRASVAHLLATQSSSKSNLADAKVKPQPEPPTLPASTTLKKIEFGLPRPSGIAIRPLETFEPEPRRRRRAPGAPVADVPHPPPRLSAVV